MPQCSRCILDTVNNLVYFRSSLPTLKHSSAVQKSTSLLPLPLPLLTCLIPKNSNPSVIRFLLSTMTFLMFLARARLINFQTTTLHMITISISRRVSNPHSDLFTASLRLSPWLSKTSYRRILPIISSAHLSPHVGPLSSLSRRRTAPFDYVSTGADSIPSQKRTDICYPSSPTSLTGYVVHAFTPRSTSRALTILSE